MKQMKVGRVRWAYAIVVLIYDLNRRMALNDLSLAEFVAGIARTNLIMVVNSDNRSSWACTIFVVNLSMSGNVTDNEEALAAQALTPSAFSWLSS